MRCHFGYPLLRTALLRSETKMGKEICHLFVGACWLVNSELRDVNNLQNDPGFSPVMFGSACLGVKTEDVELFSIW